MKKLANIVLALFLAGCFQVKTTVDVKKDGSGILTQKVMMSSEFLQSMQQMAQSFGSEEEDPDSFFDEEELKESASQYGDKVRFVSARKLEEDGLSGYEAIYEFDNIEGLSVSNSPDEEIMGQSPENMITFKFSKGNPARLQVVLPEQEMSEPKNDEQQTASEIDENTRQMLEQMYKNMKVEMYLSFDCKIIKTNSNYQDGDKIYLLQMDFKKLLEDPQTMDYLASAQAQNPAAMKSIMQNIPGVKVETKPEIFIEFK
jgi:hypothetical protein